MNFFEAWKKRAELRLGGSAKYKAQGFVAGQMYEAAVTGIDAAINALTEQGIAIKAEIIQGAKLVSKAPQTEVHLDPDSLEEYSETYIILPGHPLPEDKALVIILSLEKEDD